MHSPSNRHLSVRRQCYRFPRTIFSPESSQAKVCVDVGAPGHISADHRGACARFTSSLHVRVCVCVCVSALSARAKGSSRILMLCSSDERGADGPRRKLPLQRLRRLRPWGRSWGPLSPAVRRGASDGQQKPCFMYFCCCCERACFSYTDNSFVLHVAST